MFLFLFIRGSVSMSVKPSALTIAPVKSDVHAIADQVLLVGLCINEAPEEEGPFVMVSIIFHVLEEVLTEPTIKAISSRL